MAKHPLKRRLAARKSIAMLTGSHASLGLANRMVGFEGYKIAPPSPGMTGQECFDYLVSQGYTPAQAKYSANNLISESLKK